MAGVKPNNGAKSSEVMASFVTKRESIRKAEMHGKVSYEDLGQGIRLEMVLIPAGKFLMGLPRSEEDQDSYEMQHEVTLTKSYYIGKYAVTQEQWEAVMGNNPSYHKVENFPVTNVSWDDCQAFIKKLNKKTSGGYRLPTEAEWEYACRAGTKTTHFFGNKISPQDANYFDSKIGEPSPVGIYKPNAYGLYDMHGNVWEWCEDWFGNYPAEAVTDPRGPANGDTRVLRGASFYSLVDENKSGLRSSRRNYNYPGFTHEGLGFRLVKTVSIGQVPAKKEKNLEYKSKSPEEKKTNPANKGREFSRVEKKKEARKLLLMYANGQWEKARRLLNAAQDKHWLFEELLKNCGFEDGVPKPSMFIKEIFGENAYDVACLEMPELDIDPDHYFPIKSELAMLEVLEHLPQNLKELQKSWKKRGIHQRVLSKYWKEVVNDTFEGVEYDPVNFSDRWLAERDAEIAKIEKECKERGKALKKPWKHEEDLGNGIKLEMMLIPAGSFSRLSQSNIEHEVKLTKPYYMGRYAVTRKQWNQVMGSDDPCEDENDHEQENSPMEGISWDDCQEFIEKLNSMNNGGYRLPTEAEWEYACRAGTKTAYSFGDEITPFDANYRYSKIGGMETGGFGDGVYKPNDYGLHNMHGHVKEWCEDWYGNYPRKDTKDPKGPSKGEYRVMRGGDAISLADELCSAFRWPEDPSESELGCGLRLARNI
ncbi:MAG: hypothetical protein RL179_1254 [Planctomycetota bacterium]